ncbi:right-handed parallel beta-helix repeat-containing protein [Methanobacterium alcaliphilum]|uniref:right-handed parallel beta-helix repeat-containing protein n=1 Tax=Methanobacterium alcaliphilum TaxID=392018 RepID=UPI002009F8A3|nr:right-handed parallel beta-helix repeat-containing protein [Methanobacterium alcaliphilum]
MVLFMVSAGTIMIDPVSAADWTVNSGSNSADIQAIIDGATSGDTINFQAGNYDDIKVLINKTLNLVGNGAVLNSVNSNNTYIFKIVASGDVDASGTTVQGFEFNLINNTEAKTSAYAIQLDRVQNILIKNVTSHDGKSGVYCGNVNNTIIENCTFTDAYNKAYSVNIMGGTNITVINSSFTGGMDAISMASGASHVTVDGNTFKDNLYAAFWGGGIVYITYINNLFDNWTYGGLAIEKAANLTSIINNTFINGNGDAIYIKNSNAHGDWTNITAIDISGNVFENITNGAAIGVDKEGIFHGSGTGDSIKGTNNTVKNVSNGYVCLYSTGSNLNFTMDSHINKADKTANVSISSSVSPSAIKTGDKVTYTVTVKNKGNGSVANVVVNDILKTSSYSSYATYISQGTYSNGNWNIGTLDAGNTVSLVVTATAIRSGVTTSQAALTGDNNITAKSTSLSKTINKYIKLSYKNIISASKVKKDKYVYLATQVTNYGKDKSGTVKIKITLPKGMKLVGINYPSVYNKNTKTWTVYVPAGKTYKLQVKAKMSTTGTKKVTFNINGKNYYKYIKGY